MDTQNTQNAQQLNSSESSPGITLHATCPGKFISVLSNSRVGTIIAIKDILDASSQIDTRSL
ncbi:hypothetical protein K443DRAFT_9671 [Laccaria amethystina LaAM-08-1]|uniref:Uncharacterized protein n=1 Tax=Laccaria amethystina LaAM-08-1 TaxID=1095629 RepID=A0A0C9XNX5_9AGAR|nr:hypothetical protein K443DRAFT_9671 [Laccaria amethystina LaAM-08-1]